MSMSKYATRLDYYKAQVHAHHPDAYQYTPAPHLWRINRKVGEEIVTIGRGTTELKAWEAAARKLATPAETPSASE